MFIAALKLNGSRRIINCFAPLWAIQRRRRIDNFSIAF